MLGSKGGQAARAGDAAGNVNSGEGQCKAVWRGKVEPLPSWREGGFELAQPGPALRGAEARTQGGEQRVLGQPAAAFAPRAQRHGGERQARAAVGGGPTNWMNTPTARKTAAV